MNIVSLLMIDNFQKYYVIAKGNSCILSVKN